VTDREGSQGFDGECDPDVQRSGAAAAANAARTPAQRSQAAMKANAARTPEQPQAAARQAAATRADARSSGWDHFLEAAARARSLPDFDERERTYKLEIADDVADALRLARSEGPWLEELQSIWQRKYSGQQYNLTNWRQHEWFVRWAAADGGVRAVVAGFLSTDRDPVECFAEFAELASAAERAGSAGRMPAAVLGIGALFAFSVAPTRVPMVRARVFERCERAVDFPPAPPAPQERYGHHLTFANTAAQRMEEAGIELRDMLDVQSIVFMVSEELTDAEEPARPEATAPERVWLVRSGSDGRFESMAFDTGTVLIGWSELDDLAKLTREEIKEELRSAYGEERAGALAMMAGQLHRFVNDVRVGDLVVMPLQKNPRHVAIGRVSSPYRHRDEEKFRLNDGTHTHDVDWLARDIPYEGFDPDLREAFAQRGTLSEIRRPAAAEQVLAAAGGEGNSALHLLLRWSTDQEPRTIDLHREIAVSRGAVWWGKLGDPAARSAIGPQRRRILDDQLRRGEETYVFLYKPGEVWRVRLLEIRLDRPADEATQIPAYYRGAEGKHHLWLKLTDFEKLPPDYAETRLVRDGYTDSGSIRKALRGQSSLVGVRLSDAQAHRRRVVERLSPGRVKEVAESVPYGLRLDDDLYATVVAALESGKHVILTGPPGTAKTTLAQVLGETAERQGLSDGYLLTTATADWTTYETIGGLKPTAKGGLEFAPGHFLAAIERNQWLVIDELNRSQFDRAFGQLFTVLSGQAVTLPYTRRGASAPLTLLPEGAPPPNESADVLEIPGDWRIVATMNVFDKSLLFDMSYALMRRFAFVEVPSPGPSGFSDLIDTWAGGSAEAAATAKALLAVREIKDIGPAVYRDIVRFAAQRIRMGKVDDGELLFQAFYSYLLPQFEGIDDEKGAQLLTVVAGLTGRRTKVRDTLTSVLGIELPADAPRGTEGAEDPEDAQANLDE
jgi:MoxR-like ATPase